MRRIQGEDSGKGKTKRNNNSLWLLKKFREHDWKTIEDLEDFRDLKKVKHEEHSIVKSPVTSTPEPQSPKTAYNKLSINISDSNASTSYPEETPIHSIQ